MQRCKLQQIEPDSIGIDTWGVDFGYVAADGTLLGLPRAYRDPYTDGTPESYFDHVSREEVYHKTGIQIMNFNSLFQLYQAKKEDFALYKYADKILFMPDLLAYMLTGVMICEYTEASTSQLINPRTKSFEPELLEAVNIELSLLCVLTEPGTQTGILTPKLAKELGIGQWPVVAVAGHDTASAVVAVPAETPNFAYLSSGTWSLMGIETEAPIISEDSFRHNFTNEGGIEGTTRFLKNITGMWLLESCRRCWEKEGRTYTYDEIMNLSESAAPFTRFIFPDEARFANPENMPEAISAYCRETGQPQPQTDGDFIRCIFESLAMRYKEVLGLLRNMAPFPIDYLHVIGGGSKNDLLNQYTANAIDLPVIAGPAEATALGNCMLQAKAAGLVADRWEMRRLIRSGMQPEIFQPETGEAWEIAYNKYKEVTLKR